MKVISWPADGKVHLNLEGSIENLNVSMWRCMGRMVIFKGWNYLRVNPMIPADFIVCKASHTII